MIYGPLHRFLLRSVISQGVISLSEAERLLNGEEQHKSLQDLVKEINDAIRPYQQTLKITRDELTDEEVIVFLSLGYDEATKAQNVFSATELEYFRILIEQIMTTEARQVTSLNAINLVGSMKSSFTKTDAQKLLNTWCRMRYLEKEENNYALGVRAIHEFESYFRQNMPDVVEDCCLCKQIVLRGFNCPSCSLAVHNRCLKRYLEKVEKWPCCKTDFSASQLEQLRNADQVSHTQQSQESAEYNTIAELTQTTTADVDLTQQAHDSEGIVPEISQRITRKRKHRE
ncbi:non-structural maintenance of chromosomes element 1 homolog isoform X2 [Galleria mellonella]|uniref:Non-structural maintenance of chromosomes element 1 homolog n=1 Tax=Galleria mellonella TaxID=7137 RepID=A0A6J3CH62_GALME|nr:non-structural maintenance of chromosomes element 1 homolog isoform X2 [Galleria mellonella]